MNITEFVKPELLVLVPVLIIIGSFLKEAKKIKDNYIPLILGAIGIVLASGWTFATTAYVAKDILLGAFTGIVQGILCAGAAVYGNQIFKQLGKLKEEGGGGDDA